MPLFCFGQAAVLPCAHSSPLPGEPWKALAVQHQGRIKPFDTFAREVLRTAHGRDSFQGRSAVEAVLSWMIIPDFWEAVPFILVEDYSLKQSLGLDTAARRFSPRDLKGNAKLPLHLTELQSLRQKGEELGGYFKSLAQLETKLILYEAIKRGDLIRVQPPPRESLPAPEEAPWLSVAGLKGEAKEQFQKAIRSYISLISEQLPGAPKFEALGASGAKKGRSDLPAESSGSRLSGEASKISAAKKDRSSVFGEKGKTQGESFSAPALRTKKSSSELEAGAFEEPLKAAASSQSLAGPRLARLRGDLDQFQAIAFGGAPEKWFQKTRIKAEIFYNSFKPFQKAWIFYLLFLFLALLSYLLKKSDRLLVWLLPVFALGFVSHTLGLALRSYIMARPPVSNMYETVVWVPWAALLAGMVFFARSARIPFLASAILAFFCLFLTEAAPQILDSSLQPLEAVLRSSFWLSTHVLVITMSYSFFFLAFVLGDMALLSYVVRKKEGMGFMKKMNLPIYRSLQWGVALLAAGTALGAIWADYSWGRFWGWDPKESWALVSLLGYLALLHGRLVGWIQDMGMALGAVLMFFLVIMAWYGVNFILGAGLHSYGFGTGGAGYVAGFLALHLILCGLAFLRRFQSRRL